MSRVVQTISGIWKYVFNTFHSDKILLLQPKGKRLGLEKKKSGVEMTISSMCNTFTPQGPSLIRASLWTFFFFRPCILWLYSKPVASLKKFSIPDSIFHSSLVNLWTLNSEATMKPFYQLSCIAFSNLNYLEKNTFRVAFIAIVNCLATHIL